MRRAAHPGRARCSGQELDQELVHPFGLLVLHPMGRTRDVKYLAAVAQRQARLGETRVEG